MGYVPPIDIQRQRELARVSEGFVLASTMGKVSVAQALEAFRHLTRTPAGGYSNDRLDERHAPAYKRLACRRPLPGEE